MGTRFLAAGALLMAWMRWRAAAWPTRAVAQCRALIVGTLMLGGGMGGTAVAETSVGSGLVVAFIAVVPLMIAALNLIWGVRPGRLELAGIVVGLAGVLMLTQGAGFQARPRAGGHRDRLLDLVGGQRAEPAQPAARARRHRLRQRDAVPAARC